MGCFYCFCQGQAVPPPIAEEDIKSGSKKKKSMIRYKVTIRKKASLPLKCQSVGNGDFRRQILMLNKKFGRDFFTDVH